MDPYHERLADILERLCGQRPPDDLVRKWVESDESHSYAEEWVDTLQDWAASHCPWEWATGIGLIDAAEAVLDELRPADELRKLPPWCDSAEDCGDPGSSCLD